MAMWTKMLAVCAVLAMSFQAQAVLIGDLFNTGVDGSGTPLADGTIGDPHYTLTGVPGGTTTIRVRTSAGGFPIGPWLGDNGTSAWIGPNNDGALNGPPGVYTYRTTFTLDANADLATADITGNWSTDNPGVDILINNASTGNTTTGNFGAFTPFSINSGFVTGINTLDFILSNAGTKNNPTGLRVEMVGSYEVIPEPATASMGLLAIGGLILRRRRTA